MAVLADVLAFFGLGGAMSPKRIDQASKLACNAFAQPEVRMREMQRLLKQGTPESIAGAVRRFGANAQGHIADEEEKSWLMDALVDLGEAAKGPLEGYIRTEQKLTYSLIAHQRIAGEGASRAFFMQVLQSIGPKDHQRVEPKQQLVAALIAHAHLQEVQERLAPFLSDHSDDVVWAVLDGVEQAMDHTPARGTGGYEPHSSLHPAVVAGLAALLGHPGLSARISRRVATLLARYGAPLPGGQGPLPGPIAEQFFVDGKGILHARVSA